MLAPAQLSSSLGQSRSDKVSRASQPQLAVAQARGPGTRVLTGQTECPPGGGLGAPQTEVPCSGAPTQPQVPAEDRLGRRPRPSGSEWGGGPRTGGPCRKELGVRKPTREASRAASGVRLMALEPGLLTVAHGWRDSCRIPRRAFPHAPSEVAGVPGRACTCQGTDRGLHSPRGQHTPA